MRVNWPPNSVHTWQGALYSRSSDEWLGEHDDEQEAIESRPLHELRGLIVGQVAEIEGLLLHMGAQIRERNRGPSPARKKQRGAGGALRDIRRLLKALSLDEELSEKLEAIWQVIRRRNALVHGRIHVGFSRLSDDAPLESVITLLFENDGSDDEPSVGDDEDWEFSEFELQGYLEEAYLALEAGLDVWERVDEALPPLQR